MTKPGILFSAVVLCTGFVLSGCEDNDGGCELNRLEAARRVCLAAVQYCDQCVDWEAPICEGLSENYCETVNKYPDGPKKADDCVDMAHDVDCAVPVGKLDEYDVCSDDGRWAWNESDLSCHALFRI